MGIMSLGGNGNDSNRDQKKTGGQRKPNPNLPEEVQISIFSSSTEENRQLAEILASTGTAMRDLDSAEEKEATRLRREFRSPTLDKMIDESRQARAAQSGMQQARTGRGDTGVQRFGKHGLQMVSLASFVNEMAGAGYTLIDCYRQRQPKRDRDGAIVFQKAEGNEKQDADGFALDAKGSRINVWQWRVKLVFSRMPGVEQKVADPAHMVGRLAEWLQGKLFQHCHVWQNPDSTDTVNLTGEVKDQKSARSFCTLHLADGKYSSESTPDSSRDPRRPR